MHKAFTLIELLIVVAIIAILAAIAVPNFLEAQTRAKVSRTKADIRSLATAIEAYAVDNNNKYPFDWDSRGWPWKMTDAVSTPIAYITAASIMSDPFRAQLRPPEASRFRFLNFPANIAIPPATGWLPCQFPGPYRTRWDTTDYSDASRQGIEAWGLWKISSAGPDRTVNSSFFLADLNYDPSNGTISGGDIIRSQKFNQK